jgi:cadmium resistance protein CadD (predicted permease)
MAKERTRASSKPELRHEFVAMVFAVTIGEVGVQLSTLIKQPCFFGLLPGYSHLFLATILIAASFVGWTQSPSEGARRDVRKVLEWEFMVLLVDTLLVVCYFIMVRAVDFDAGEGAEKSKYVPAAGPEAGWILAIFGIYLLWDIVTKFIVKPNNSEDEPATEEEKKKKAGSQLVRVLVTAICVALAVWAVLWMADAKLGNVVLADLGLTALVLLFRALKDVASAFWPGKEVKGAKRDEWLAEISEAKKHSLRWAVALLVPFLFSLFWVHAKVPICPKLDAAIQQELDRVAAGEKLGAKGAFEAARQSAH